MAPLLPQRNGIRVWLLIAATVLLTLMPVPPVDAGSRSDDVAEALMRLRKVMDDQFESTQLPASDEGMTAILRTIAHRDGEDFAKNVRGEQLARRLNELIADPSFGPEKVEDLLEQCRNLARWIDDNAPTPQIRIEWHRRLARTFLEVADQSDSNRVARAAAAEIAVIDAYRAANRLVEIQPLAPQVGDTKLYRDAIIRDVNGDLAYLEVKNWGDWRWDQMMEWEMNKQIKTHFHRSFDDLDLSDGLDVVDLSEVRPLVFHLQMRDADVFHHFRDEVIPDAIRSRLRKLMRQSDEVDPVEYADAVESYLSTKLVIESF